MIDFHFECENDCIERCEWKVPLEQGQKLLTISGPNGEEQCLNACRQNPECNHVEMENSECRMTKDCVKVNTGFILGVKRFTKLGKHWLLYFCCNFESEFSNQTFSLSIFICIFVNYLM